MEAEPIAGSSKPVDERLQGWTKSEIFDLLQGIKVFGSRKVTKIAATIPTKTTEQITKALEYYREKAVQQANVPIKRNIQPPKKTTKQPPKKTTKRPPVPLNSWAQLLQDSLSFKELHTETATALRLIAEFEDIPSPKHTENVDFKNVYHALANAVEGKEIPEDPALATILEKCIVDTALTSKAFMRTGELQNVVKSVIVSDKPITVLPQPTDNTELATLRHLAAQRAYNPLNISEQHLKPG